MPRMPSRQAPLLRQAPPLLLQESPACSGSAKQPGAAEGVRNTPKARRTESRGCPDGGRTLAALVADAGIASWDMACRWQGDRIGQWRHRTSGTVGNRVAQVHGPQSTRLPQVVAHRCRMCRRRSVGRRACVCPCASPCACPCGSPCRCPVGGDAWLCAGAGDGSCRGHRRLGCALRGDLGSVAKKRGERHAQRQAARSRAMLRRVSEMERDFARGIKASWVHERASSSSHATSGGGGRLPVRRSPSSVVEVAGSCRHTLAQERTRSMCPHSRGRDRGRVVLIGQQMRVTDDARGVREKLGQLWPPLTPSRSGSRPSFLIGRHGRRDCGDPPHAAGRTRHLLRCGLRAGHGGVCPGRGSPERWLTAVPPRPAHRAGHRVPGALWAWRGGGRGWGVATRGGEKRVSQVSGANVSTARLPPLLSSTGEGVGGEGRSGLGCEGS